MSSGSLMAYILDFTVSSGTPKVTFITQAPLPTSSSLQSSISNLIAYINTNGINISNYGIVNNTTTDIINQCKSTLTSSPALTTLYTSISASTSDSTQLTTYLTNLQTYVSTSSTTTSTFVSPEDDNGTATGATSNGSVRNKMGSTTVSSTSYKSIGSIVKSIQGDSITNATTNNSFITKIKAGFQEVTNPSNTTSSNLSTAIIVPNKNGMAEVNPNLIGNFVSNLFSGGRYSRFNRSNNPRNRGGRGRGNNNDQHGDNNGSDPIKQIYNFTPTNVTTDNTIVTTNNIIGDGYEIYTSSVPNANGTNNLQVTFAYFTSGSTSSTFACTYMLTPKSLISLSISAYNASKRLSTIEQSKLVSQAGVSISSIPSNQELWNSYLVWMLSFVSFGVASSLGASINVPYSGSVTGSANYMLNRNYVDNISNISLPISLMTRSSDKASLLSTGIAGSWSDLMYEDSPDSSSSKTTYGSAKTIADTIISTIKTTTDTSTSTSTSTST